MDAGDDSVEGQGRRKRRKMTPSRSGGQSREGLDRQGQSSEAANGRSPSVDVTDLTTSDAPPGSTLQPRSKMSAVTQRDAPKPLESNDRSPPKKMIKLRGDGRLTSPTLKAPAENKPRRGRPPKNQALDIRTKVVVVRYGTDGASRSATGESIEGILAGSKRARPALAPKIIQAKVKKKPAEPAKPLHPLFLGNKPGPKATDEQKAVIRLSPRKQKNDKTEVSPAKKAVHHSLGVSATAKSWPSFSTAQKSRHPNSVHPRWPTKGTAHVTDYEAGVKEPPAMLQGFRLQKKLKQSQVRVPANDEVIKPCLEIVQMVYEHNRNHKSSDTGVSLLRDFKKPRRMVMSSKELQSALLPELGVEHSSSVDKPSWHPAVSRLFHGLEHTLSPFDRFECDDTDWVHKYAPKTVADTLQPPHRLALLHDWLRSLVINSTSNATKASTALKQKRGRKRRKRGTNLDDFIVSEGEDGSVYDDGSESEDILEFHAARQPHHYTPLRKLTQASLSATKAVLISGPHGCGKTASVYAVAQELGFEVFEISAGTRRSGRDILDRVGDMTQNHLVNRPAQYAEDADQSEEASLKVQEEIDSGRQSTMKSFFQAKGAKKAAPRSKATSKSTEPPRPTRQQKQSLILLEEVDVLFEEDKAFWTSVAHFITDSRRPVIMTCSDERLIPQAELEFLSVLRMIPPPEELATNYLLLLAANEGHLLSLPSIRALYSSHSLDLRASITDLNFWCQMALGDAKGGLDWMLLRSNPTESQNEHGDQLRVISEATYTKHMGILGSKTLESYTHRDKEVEVVSDALGSHQFDGDEWFTVERWAPLENEHSNGKPRQYDYLCGVDRVLDTLSMADMVQGVGSLSANTVSQS